jgi:L-lysine exporter family protein LysE/ArgO
MTQDIIAFDIIPFWAGLMTSAGLIMAIGPQNAFVLKQGLLKNQLLVTALLCSFADTILIFVGVVGVGGILAANALLMTLAKWGGAAFLFYYGYNCFQAALKRNVLKAEAGNDLPGLQKTILMCLALSFLNPHAILDTVVLLGSISSQYQERDRFYFTLGAISMSFIWFFVVCYGARYLAPIFKKPKSWQILDIVIGIMMWGIGLSLIF